MRIYGMKVNQLIEPRGYQLSPLRLSYKVLCEGGKRQVSARIRIYSKGETVFDSGVREDIDSLCYEPGLALAPRTCYEWDVEVTADNGETALSPRAHFETGKMSEAWSGQWIAADGNVVSPRMFKRFALPGRAASARLYICLSLIHI